MHSTSSKYPDSFQPGTLSSFQEQEEEEEATNIFAFLKL
jgi:hypothetical protein